MLTNGLLFLLLAASPIKTQNAIGTNLNTGGKRYCIAPPQPASGGTYSLEGVPHPTVKYAYESFKLTYRCFTYHVMRGGDEVVMCKNGDWIYNIPECVHYQTLYASIPTRPPREDCEVPPHPVGGRYSVQEKPNASPGDAFEFLQLTLTCNYRFQLEGAQTALCIKGKWSGDLPKCVHISSGCDLRKHSSVEYRCKNDTHNFGLCANEVASGTTVGLRCKADYKDTNMWRITNMYCVDGYWDSVAVCTPKNGQSGCELYKHPSVEYRCSSDTPGYRVCDDVEPNGSVVRIRCRIKDIPKDSLSSAHLFCVEGNWYHVASCTPSVDQNNAECGIQTGNRPLVFGGKAAVRGELPWHAGIFAKTETPYLLICGGSLINRSLIISAAHCFWDDLEKQLPAANYAVAVGKLLQAWNDSRDLDAQTSDVSEIIIPPLFQGNAANFQEDIALLRVASPFVYGRHVRPICLDFDYDFENEQLKQGNTGKVGGWGLTAGGRGQSPVLRIADMPYVTQADCIRGTSPSFAAYVTGDKICAGTNGTAVCRGDSGGGLAFRGVMKGVARFYLRGIVSTAPSSGEECDGTTWATFTSVNRHQHFIRKYL